MGSKVKRVSVKLDAENFVEVARVFKANLTHSGLFLTGSTLPEGTEVLAEVLFRDGSRALAGRGEVTTVRGQGMSLEVEWDGDSQQGLRTILATPTVPPPAPAGSSEDGEQTSSRPAAAGGSWAEHVEIKSVEPPPMDDDPTERQSVPPEVLEMGAASSTEPEPDAVSELPETGDLALPGDTEDKEAASPATPSVEPEPDRKAQNAPGQSVGTGEGSPIAISYAIGDAPLQFGLTVGGPRELSRDETVTLSDYDHDELILGVFEGDVDANDSLGSMSIANVPHSDGSTMLRLFFRIDDNQVLHLEVRELGTGMSVDGRFPTSGTPQAVRDRISMPPPRKPSGVIGWLKRTFSGN